MEKEKFSSDSGAEKGSEGVIERSREWLKKNSKVLILGAALFGSGIASGVHGERYALEHSEDKLEELIAKDQNLSQAHVEGESFEETDNGSSTIIARINLGLDSDVQATAIVDKDGKLIKLFLLGDSRRGKTNVFADVKDKNKLNIGEVEIGMTKEGVHDEGSHTDTDKTLNRNTSYEDALREARQQGKNQSENLKE